MEASARFKRTVCRTLYLFVSSPTPGVGSEGQQDHDGLTGGLVRLQNAAFDVYVVAMNFLLRLPGHAFRIFILRYLCRWEVGLDTSVERGVIVTTKGGVTVGRQCLIHRGAIMDGRGKLTIGDLVNIGPDVACLSADHDPDSGHFAGRLRPVVIESRSWLATRAMVLPGAIVHEGVVVGAGSVVTGDIAAWTVVAGSPARTIRQRSPSAQSTLPRYRRWLH